MSSASSKGLLLLVVIAVQVHCAIPAASPGSRPPRRSPARMRTASGQCDISSGEVACLAFVGGLGKSAIALQAVDLQQHPALPWFWGGAASLCRSREATTSRDNARGLHMAADAFAVGRLRGGRVIARSAHGWSGDGTFSRPQAQAPVYTRTRGSGGLQPLAVRYLLLFCNFMSTP